MILVYSTEKKIRHSQSIFRLFLAVSDIIVGLIILPAAVDMTLRFYRYTLELQAPISVIGQKRFLSSNGTYIYKNTSLTIYMLETTEMAQNRVFPLFYQNIIGFFTTLSLTVSFYILTVSGIDRLRALSKPLLYNLNVAKRFAISISVVCWVLAIFFSIFPMFVNSLYYKITSASFVTMRGYPSVYVYLIEAIIPLVATWIISVYLYLIARKVLDGDLCSSTEEVNLEQHRKLNFTLSLMVVTFSFSVFPTILALVIQLLDPQVNPGSPEKYNTAHDNFIKSFQLTALVILSCNSLWNCLIYSLRGNNFRRIALKKYKIIWNGVKCSNSLPKLKNKIEL